MHCLKLEVLGCTGLCVQVGQWVEPLKYNRQCKEAVLISMQRHTASVVVVDCGKICEWVETGMKAMGSKITTVAVTILKSDAH